MNFRVYCLMSNKKLPKPNEEILRNLYAHYWDNKKACEAMVAHNLLLLELFPIKFNQNMLTLLNCGGIYIHGRDKNLRPVLACNVQKLLQAQKHFGENNSDLKHMLIFLMEYLDHFVMIKGRVENVLLIVDCINIGLFNAPYVLINQMLKVLHEYAQCKIRSIICLNAASSFSVFKTL